MAYYPSYVGDVYDDVIIQYIRIPILIDHDSMEWGRDFEHCSDEFHGTIMGLRWDYNDR